MLENQVPIRLGVFLAILLLMSLLEAMIPKRDASVPRSQRWVDHFLLTTTNTILLRLLPWIAPVAVAIWGAERNFGLLPWLPLPLWCQGLLGLLLLDLTLFLQHMFSHRISWLWSFHQVHHSDLHLDATSGFRFHAIEMIFSSIVKSVVVLLLGISPEVVLLFEIILNAAAIFSHSNIAIPIAIDRWLRYLIVTPDMHRIHHSIDWKESNSNFGFNISWWDRLFGCYLQTPTLPQEKMILGLPDAPGNPRKNLRFLQLLLMPWVQRRSR